MYTIYDLIFVCIMSGFCGIILGLVIMAVVSKDDYEVGYEKGKEEEKKQFMRKLDEYEKGECVSERT